MRRPRILVALVLAVLPATLMVAGLTAPAVADNPHGPVPTQPTHGWCHFTPMADQTYSTFVGLPPDPATPTTHGRASISLHTDQGTIPIVLDRAAAPCAVRSLQFLAHRKYYDDTACHRITAYHTPPYALSVLQCGDPLGTGEGDPGYSFRDELASAQALPNWPGFPDGSRKVYPRGTLAMANAGPDTNGSQFFLVYADSRLSPAYTVFGQVTPEGLAVLDRIAAAGVAPTDPGYPEDGAPALRTVIVRAKSGA